MNPEVVLKIDAIDNSKAAFQSVERSLDRAKASTSGLRDSMEKLKPGIEQVTLASGVATAAIGGLIYKTTQSASNLEESINAVNVVFGDGADKILSFGENAARTVGLSNAAFNQMATVTGALLKDTGLELEDVADMTNELTVRAADMASVFNTDVSDAMSAINQAIRGETEAIRRYAGDVTDATLQTYLLSQGIQTSVTDLTEQEKRLYRVQVIMQQTEVTAGDFTDTIDSLANRQRTLQATFEDLSADLGKQFIPVLTSVLEAVAPLIDRTAAWIEQNPELARNIVLVTGAIAGLLTVLGTLTLALLALNPVSVIVVGAIAAIMLIIHSIGNALEMFGLTWGDVWDGIKNAVKAAVDWIKDFALSPLENKLNSIIDLFKTVISFSPAGIVGRAAGKAFSSISSRLQSVDDAVITPKGDIISTHPDDWLIATKNPAQLAAAGAHGGQITINITGNSFMGERDMAEKVGDMIIGKLKLNQRL